MRLIQFAVREREISANSASGRSPNRPPALQAAPGTRICCVLGGRPDSPRRTSGHGVGQMNRMGRHRRPRPRLPHRIPPRARLAWMPRLGPARGGCECLFPRKTNTSAHLVPGVRISFRISRQCLYVLDVRSSGTFRRRAPLVFVGTGAARPRSLAPRLVVGDDRQPKAIGTLVSLLL
jgi:hypothetical protein